MYTPGIIKTGFGSPFLGLGLVARAALLCVFVCKKRCEQILAAIKNVWTLGYYSSVGFLFFLSLGYYFTLGFYFNLP